MGIGPGSTRGGAVTIVAIATLVVAGVLAGVGGYSLNRFGATAFAPPPEDEIARSMHGAVVKMAYIAGAGVVTGVVLFVAGLGLLGRARWARTVTLVIALPLLLVFGWVLWVAVNDPNVRDNLSQSAPAFAFSSANFAYSLVSLIVLVVKRDEF